MDFIQQQVDESNGVQLQTIITVCKKFIADCRKHATFNESTPLVNVLIALRDAAVAECIRREIDFTV